MRKIRKEIKKYNKKVLLNKIHQDRAAETQELGWLFRPLALCPFPAQNISKIRTVKDIVTDERFEIKEQIWKRKSVNIEVEILGHPDYGVPFGQDILVILYLVIEARKQKKRKIEVNFYRDFCRMFGFNPNDGRKYKLIVESLNRISHSKYMWNDKKEEFRQKEFHYIYIEEIDLYCNPKNPNQKPMFSQYILLSERFWDEINRHRIPFNLKAIRYLKTKSAHLNFYLWLSYRVALNYLKYYNQFQDYKNRLKKDPELMIGSHKPKAKKEFIPFWGENGLVNQLSTKITKRYEFRREVKKWIKETAEIWPNLPVKIDGDQLVICTTNPDQLDVQIDSLIESGRELRKSQEAKKLENKEHGGFSKKQYEFLERWGTDDVKEKLRAGKLSYKEGSKEIKNTKLLWDRSKKIP